MACVFECPVPVGNPYQTLDECKEVVLAPTTCAQAENNWSILAKILEVVNLLRCKYLEGSETISYRYKQKLSSPVYFVTVAATKLVGVDPDNVIFSVNGVQCYHTSQLFGAIRYEFDSAMDKISFYDDNNAALTLGAVDNVDFIDLIILK